MGLANMSTIFIPLDREKFLCLGWLITPFLTPPLHRLCAAWCGIMSLGEVMVCLSAPEGLPTRSCKEKATRSEYYTALLFSNISFKVSAAIVFRLSLTALFFCIRKPSNSQRGDGKNKDQLEREALVVCEALVFIHYAYVLIDSLNIWNTDALFLFVIAYPHLKTLRTEEFWHTCIM